MISAISLALFSSILFWWNPLPLVGVLGVFVVGFAMAPMFAGMISSTSQRVATSTPPIQSASRSAQPVWAGPSCQHWLGG